MRECSVMMQSLTSDMMALTLTDSPFNRTMSFRKDSDVVVRCVLCLKSRNVLIDFIADMDTLRKEQILCLRGIFHKFMVR